MKFKPNFQILTFIGDRQACVEGVPDPFFRTQIRLSVWDRLRVLCGAPLELRVRGARKGVIDAVMKVLLIEEEEEP